MNRRGFLKLLGIAPAVAPAMARAAADEINHRTFLSSFYGVNFSSADGLSAIDLGDGGFYVPDKLAQAIGKHLMTPNQARALIGLAPMSLQSVEDQMAEHDLFEPEDIVPALTRSYEGRVA